MPFNANINHFLIEIDEIMSFQKLQQRLRQSADGLLLCEPINLNWPIVKNPQSVYPCIQGLDWSGSETPEIFKDIRDTEKEENDSFSLLAVSSRDKTVSIWQLKDASKMAELKLPFSRGGNKSGLILHSFT